MWRPVLGYFVVQLQTMANFSKSLMAAWYDSTPIIGRLFVQHWQYAE
jgi:hypothetical protein